MKYTVILKVTQPCDSDRDTYLFHIDAIDRDQAEELAWEDWASTREIPAEDRDEYEWSALYVFPGHQEAI